VLHPRTETVLRSIVERYIERAVPIASQSLVTGYDLGVSSATVRNEMALLEQEGFIIRPHTSAGSIPSDKGYRWYVASLSATQLPISEQRLISHLFHQVEGRVEEWLSLAAALVSRMSQNTAVVTVPKPADCQFRHLELVLLQDSLVLIVLVLRGARIRQLLVPFGRTVTQDYLTTLSNKLNVIYSSLTAKQIETSAADLPADEKPLNEFMVKMMKAEDAQEYNQSYLEGLHFMLNQPEFSHSQRILALMELLEHRSLLGTILPSELDFQEVQVSIGSENKSEVIQECSLVFSRYGLPNEACGTIGVVGPTRMPYARIISTVSYLSLVLSQLVGELYGVSVLDKNNPANSN
jgi:heat-inducible transcriptional repressor